MNTIPLSFRTTVLIIAFFLPVSMSASSNPDDLPSLKGKKVLFVYGGWKGHEPEQCVAILLPWLKAEGAVVDTFSTLAPYADQKYLESIDLIIQIFTMSKITAEQEKGLLTAIKNGAGIAGWHGGLGDA